MNPEFPIYVVSKGRWDSCWTMRYLDLLKVPYHVVIEEQEWLDYATVIDPSRLLVLDKRYLQEYDTCDDLGDTKSKGPGAARNFAWAHSINVYSAPWHWVMDDNIKGFYRFNQNRKIQVADGAVLKIMEDFCLRYTNIAMAGPAYESMNRRKEYKPHAYILNTRIYSCNLIRNDMPFRWRGRYNEDTDLSLRILKAGWCTVQFNGFLQKKLANQRLQGGNTKDFYSKEGTLPKSKMLVKLHFDCAQLKFKWNRWHHYVDYKRFTHKLIRKPDAVVPAGVDEFGMHLITVPKQLQYPPPLTH